MRILIVDDEPTMHDSYWRSLVPSGGDDGTALGAMAAELFGGDSAGAAEAPAFVLTHALQGMDGVAAVETALAEGKPFAVAFIDIRMPPGIDGKETAARIRALDPDINLVIVTGYSDFSLAEISRAAGPADKIFYIAKPFEVEEVRQMAHALSSRWMLDAELQETQASLAQQVALLEQQGRDLMASEEQAVYIATHDSLTGAPNRLAFQRALGERVARPGSFALAMLDLDRFKIINDTLGHLAGDELLRHIFRILGTTVPEGGQIARLGGDEFAILFDSPGEAAAEMACDRIMLACTANVELLGHPVQSSVSIGLVYLDEDDNRDAADVLRRADLALNAVKQGQRGVVRLYSDNMDDAIRFRRQIETGLDQAIERGELQLAYQPIVAREGLTVVGFEALLRWDTEEFGRISPDVFIPIAEDSNLIHKLGDWVIKESLAALKGWPDQYVSVNFSPRQFRRHNFVGHIIECLLKAGIAPNRFQIEITETAIFDDADRAAETLYRLRQMGFRVALDDFGTGYSSLYNIRKFSLDSLKIDKSFIDGMGRERESAAIVHSIIHLGRALGLGVIAEGVETEAQLQALRLAGASHLQGYYFAEPMTGEDAKDLAHNGFLVELDDPIEQPRDGTNG